MKDTYVEPGQQPALIRDLLDEAVDYMRVHDLVSVPAVGAESMHMIMMSPQAELSNPFFLGGPLIQVSCRPTPWSTTRACRACGATTPRSRTHGVHEMIPGHYLTQFMDAQFVRQGSRANLNISTPFYTEGWALYRAGPLRARLRQDTRAEDGAFLADAPLRPHHLLAQGSTWASGRPECIEFLIDKVGHPNGQRHGRGAAVVQGSYGRCIRPAISSEVCSCALGASWSTRRMTNRQFHDAILKQGTMPIAGCFALPSCRSRSRDMSLDWKFYGDLGVQPVAPHARAQLFPADLEQLSGARDLVG